jgi:hypothetical protein
MGLFCSIVIKLKQRIISNKPATYYQMEEKMKKRIQVTISGLMFVSLICMLTGCSYKILAKRDIRSDVKTEKVELNDPFADLRAIPASTQQDHKDQVTVSIEYLRIMKESDYPCIGIPYDPKNPRILMAFSMLNTSDRVREYTPFFVFKGQKNLNLSDKDPCRFFKSYGGLTQILAKEGSRFSLNCGEGSDTTKTDATAASSGKSVTLYPEVPVYGILIVSVDGNNIDNLKPGVTKTTKISGHAAFFETPVQGKTPANFRFNYTFDRKDWVEEMLYEKITPFTYTVNIYDWYRDTIVLGRFISSTEEERVEGSELYQNPQYNRIGPVKNKK